MKWKESHAYRLDFQEWLRSSRRYTSVYLVIQNLGKYTVDSKRRYEDPAASL